MTISNEERTIRELGGEIWSEARGVLIENGASDADHRSLTLFLDIVMGVLARHEGKKIANDADMPVKLL